jgi:hypothetical protein
MGCVSDFYGNSLQCHQTWLAGKPRHWHLKGKHIEKASNYPRGIFQQAMCDYQRVSLKYQENITIAESLSAQIIKYQ